MCDCGSSEAGKYFARVGGQFGDLATSKAMRLAEMGKSRIKSWTGFGDYKIVSNSLINNSGNGGMGITTNGRSTIIRGREYIGDVYTHPTVVGAFNGTTFTINPGNLATFPWLNTIATQFEQYKPRGIIFEFRSTATDTTTNASLGSIIIATDYDLVDATYTNKAEMVNSAYSSEAKMTDGMLHGIECDPEELNRKVYFVRNSMQSTYTGTDRDYDVCKTTIATQGGGLAAGQSVGSLYIHYEFEFLKEQVYGGISQKTAINCFYKNSVIPATPTIENWKLVPLAGTNLGLTFANGAIVFPQYWAGATFKFSFTFSQGTVWTVSNPTNLVYQGCSQVFPPNNVLLGGSNWCTYLSPYIGTTAGIPGTSAAETWVKLNQPLTVPAQMAWPLLSTWGMLPASLAADAALVMQVELVNTGFNIPI
jgi:hypothetical protein